MRVRENGWFHQDCWFLKMEAHSNNWAAGSRAQVYLVAFWVCRWALFVGGWLQRTTLIANIVVSALCFLFLLVGWCLK